MLRADVVCRDGTIERIGEAGSEAIDEQIDARGLLVLPGFMDPHVHSRDPGLTHKEDFAHSTRAAAAGGITMLCEMPNAIPPVTSATILEERAVQHERVAHVDFGLWGMALGQENLGEIAGLFRAGTIGVKLFWGYALHRQTRTLVYNLADVPAAELIPPPGNGDVLELCREVARVGGLLAAHCEDRGLIDAAERRLERPISSYAELLEHRPDTAEAVSIAVAAELSAVSGCRFHVVHTASKSGIRAVRRAQTEGVRLTAETCPHYLAFSAADFADLGVMMKVYPPIRGEADQSALWDAVRDGTITSIGSDHAPHTVEEKSQGLTSAPAGVQGVETLGPVMVDAMLNGKLTPERLAWVLSEGTARLYGLYPRKGAIQIGADADFTLVDPEAVTTVDSSRLHSKQPQSPWNGRRLRGAIRMTVLHGDVIARDGEPLGQPRGRFVRAAHARDAHQRTKRPLAFTAELDEVVSPDVPPATLFRP